MKKLSCLFMLVLLARPAFAGQRQDFANQLVVLMNSVRGATGLPQLQVNVQLTQSAQEFAALMAARNWLCHIAPDGSDPNVRDQRAGYLPVVFGEDLAAGPPTPELVFQAFMNSPPHRALILFPGFNEVGAAAVEAPGTPYGIYWAVEFGARFAQAPAAPACDNAVHQ